MPRRRCWQGRLVPVLTVGSLRRAVARFGVVGPKSLESAAAVDFPGAEDKESDINGTSPVVR